MGAEQKAAFVAHYGGVYEDSPWVAERAFDLGNDASVAVRLKRVVESASSAEQLALIRAHPDLAGKAAARGELTSESTAEQRSAGLDNCSVEELALFQSLNARYKEKFGFPFVMAVRGRSRAEILAAFGARLAHTSEVEFREALAQIHTIAALRLSEMAPLESASEERS